MKNKKSNQDKVIEAIEQDTLDEVYETLKEGYQNDKKIAVLRKAFSNKDGYENVDFAKITSFSNGFELENISGETGTSTRIFEVDKEGNLMTNGTFIQKLINSRVGNDIHGKYDVIYHIDAISEQEYVEERIKSTEDKLINEMNDKMRAYDSAIRNGTIHYMKNDIEYNEHNIRDLKEEVISMCVWFGIFITLLFMGLVAIFTKLPK